MEKSSAVLIIVNFNIPYKKNDCQQSQIPNMKNPQSRR